MIARPKCRPHIVVVDAQPNDYATLARCGPLREAELEFLESGRAALRYKNDVAPRLWVINMRLPDMNGLDLYAMLNDHWPDTPVYLVGDDYRPEDEINARMSGATFYFCKPLNGDWIAAMIDDHVGAS